MKSKNNITVSKRTRKPNALWQLIDYNLFKTLVVLFLVCIVLETLQQPITDMELLCCEGGEQLKRAFLDPVFLNDNRVLQNLLKVEEHYTIASEYMKFQTDIKPFMRKVVTQWMREVSFYYYYYLTLLLIFSHFYKYSWRLATGGWQLVIFTKI